ncbi:MAG: hypothetical protein EBS65_25100, partial [Betaproteobacteria bacterium]|nr:hypothetical protein [Betaproteobacteria bacterium]
MDSAADLLRLVLRFDHPADAVLSRYFREFRLGPRERATLAETAYSVLRKKILYTDTDLKLWVLDVASGQAKSVGEDPWMVPTRTMNPVWSPDSKWIAYVKHLNSLYKAIAAYNVETGVTKQVTDGLSDVISPAWDASGKYLWFFASTDYGLKSQWLDMSNYDHDETFALYLAVLSKNEPSPFLPESDEETGVAAAGAGGRGGRGGANAEGADAAPRAASGPVTIDWDGLAGRIIAVPGVTNRQYGRLKAGVAGTVYFTETVAASGTAGGASATLHRYQLRDRRATSFVTGVADYDVSADGHKLIYRSGGGGGRGGAAAAGGPAVFVVDADIVSADLLIEPFLQHFVFLVFERTLGDFVVIVLHVFAVGFAAGLQLLVV